MALSSSPRKVVPLSTGDDWIPRPRAKSTVHNVTKRVFFCGVAVEGSDSGREIPQDIQDLIASLGEPLDLESETEPMQSIPHEDVDQASTGARRRAMTNSSALADIIKELVVTERSYVSRLKMLKNDYADPLRSFARHKDTAILPPYEAKTLFGNIDNFLPVNEAFLGDLEKMGSPGGLGVGDVALKHFKKLRGFEHYKQYYAKREEAQAIFEREIKKSSGFAAFVDRIKYSSADTRNRVGLRELLMEPVQRIPRYTLMFRTMMKHMAPNDPQRKALLEADEMASRIALAETDEQTKRAAIMYCLSASIEDFPPALVSHGRRFIDCIDVEDVPIDGSTSSAVMTGAASAPIGGNLHCTLFLFDDKLMVIKRPGNGEKGGRALAGLDDLEKMAKAGGLPLGKKKSGMSCKGVVDLMDVVVTDVGGPNIHLYLEDPPQDQGDRWSGRPFRSLSVVYPPAPIGFDPASTEANKKRFLSNLWDAQGRYRTKKGQSVLLCGDEREVENKSGRTTLARTYFNLYTRTAFLQEGKKTKVVLHIDPLGSADPIPFGMRGPPFVVIRVQPLAGDLSRYKVTSSDPNDEEEEDIVQTERVPERVVHTIHQYGLFKFHTGRNSVPSTPTATSRSRAAIFGLDAISRNLFNPRPGSAMGDLFSGSTSGHRRTRTYGSRTSTYTDATSSGDGSFSRFSRTNSTATAATSIADDQSLDMSTSSRRSRSLSRAKKLIKKPKSPKDAESRNDQETSPRRTLSRSVPPPSPSMSPSREGQEVFGDEDDEDDSLLPQTFHLDESERDLAMRLKLARHNSQNQHEQQLTPLALERPTEDPIYEDDPPNTVRPFSRASRELPAIPQDSQSQRSVTPRPTTPHRAETPDASSRRSTSPYRSSERRPIGPRTPSPLPPLQSPYASSVTDFPSLDADLTLENTLVNLTHAPVTPIRSPLPRSRRQPFDPTDNLDSTPKVSVAEPSKASGSVEPLSIKKKTFVRATTPTSPPGRKSYSPALGSPRNKQNVSPKRTSIPNRTSRIPVPQKTIASIHIEDSSHLIRLIETTKEDVDSSRRAVKRIRLETDKLRSIGSNMVSTEEPDRPSSPFKGFRTPTRTTAPLTREAQARMEEMRQLIGRRNADGTRRARAQSVLSAVGSSPTLPQLSETPPRVNEVSRSIEELADHAEDHLSDATDKQEALHTGLQTLVAQLNSQAHELERTKSELQHSKRQCELVKSLLTDCTTEKEIMYEAFNEELDGMFNDASLPEDEAWAAMTKDLRKTKEARNELSMENMTLKRRLAEADLQVEEWGALLRAHGLIP